MTRHLIRGLLAGAVLVAGCGNERTRPPDVSRIRPPGVLRTVTFPGAGVSVDLPRSWVRRSATAPALASTGSGDATLTLWRYPRSEMLPAGRPSLVRARDALEAEIRRRDPSARILSARVTRADGAAAVVVLARETIRGLPRRVRSLHVYAERAELVLDAFAPPAAFAQVDRDVFVPVVRSLRVSAPR